MFSFPSGVRTSEMKAEPRTAPSSRVLRLQAAPGISGAPGFVSASAAKPLADTEPTPMKSSMFPGVSVPNVDLFFDHDFLNGMRPRNEQGFLGHRYRSIFLSAKEHSMKKWRLSRFFECFKIIKSHSKTVCYVQKTRNISSLEPLV